MCGHCGCHSPRHLRLEADILAHNDRHAQANRAWMDARGLTALNLVSAPGSGKTTLLVRTLERLRRPAVVIVGDQQTELDARRVQATGTPALQVNTGRGCHLEADQVQRALRRLDPPPGALVFIENVGNLVCPAAFDLGEHQRVALLSVTEGEDKPRKYPELFHSAQRLLLTKTDLLPHLDFDLDACLAHARAANPRLEVLPLSARTGDGLDYWLAWLERLAPTP